MSTANEKAAATRSIGELVQFKIIEQPYDVQVPNFVQVDIERPVFVEKIYEVPIITEVQYEKPIVNEKQMTAELTEFIKTTITKAVNEAIANLKFSFELPMPKILKVERR
jgi:hypothetical protein